MRGTVFGTAYAYILKLIIMEMLRRQAWALLVLAAAACSGSNPIGPSNQPEIGNQTDNFQFQASNLTQTTQTLSYSWTNTGGTANVNHSGHIDAGQARLVIRDASGTEVYERDLRTTGTFVTSTGSSGAWRIEVHLSAVAGTVNFRVQRRS